VISHFLVHHFQVLGVSFQGWMFAAAAIILVFIYFSMRSLR
jgi:hypothetical protein